MTKEQIKQKAEKLATFLGYDVNSPSLNVINALEMYCQGYLQAIQDHDISTQVKYSGESSRENVYDDENPDYIRNNEDGI